MNTRSPCDPDSSKESIRRLSEEESKSQKACSVEGKLKADIPDLWQQNKANIVGQKEKSSSSAVTSPQLGPSKPPVFTN
jgi:hypothetical protein